MKFVLKYALRGFYIGIWSLLLTVIAIIFILVLNETESVSIVIPYLHAVYMDVVIPYIIPTAQFTLVTILEHYWHWALLVLLLPLIIGCGIGMMKRRANKGATDRA